MSLGKKKSGFRITSVTSEYEQKEAPLGGESKGLSGRLTMLVAEEASPAEDDARQANGGVGPKNGPLPPSLFQGSVAGPSGSRFRVVKLDQGSGEPYRRGRWTCRDFYEQELDPHLTGRLADPGRHPQSLDSRLEVVGLQGKASPPFSPQPQRRGVGLQSQLVLPAPGAPAHQARSLGGGLPVLLLHSRNAPSPRSGAELRAPAPEGPPREHPGEPPLPSPVPQLRVEEPLLPKSVAQLIQREAAEERRQVVPRESRSRPSSPAPPLFRDASPARRTSDPLGTARFSLARSMFGMGLAQDSDDDSGTNSSLVAIDNKIEQAMDLVKSHLMFAVREEVEVLRDQIRDLLERNTALEQENSLLRSLANVEQLGSPRPSHPPAALPDPEGREGH